MDVATIMDVFVSYGFETDDELTDDRKLEALNEVYWDASGREAWPFLEDSVSLTFDGTTGVPTNDPGDIGSVQRVFRDADGWVLQPQRADDFYQTFASNLSDPGQPLLYYFEADQIKVYPIPSSTDTVTVKYTKIPAELTEVSVESEIVIPKRFHRAVLVIGTLAKLAMLQDDPDMAQQYDALYERQLAKMVDDVFRQQTDRPDYIHVSDWDNYDYS